MCRVADACHGMSCELASPRTLPGRSLRTPKLSTLEHLTPQTKKTGYLMAPSIQNHALNPLAGFP